MERLMEACEYLVAAPDMRVRLDRDKGLMVILTRALPGKDKKGSDKWKEEAHITSQASWEKSPYYKRVTANYFHATVNEFWLNMRE